MTLSGSSVAVKLLMSQSHNFVRKQETKILLTGVMKK